MQRAVPVTIQSVRLVNGHVIPNGPKIRYHDPSHISNRIGNLIFDAFEGNSTTGGNPDAPTDLNYLEHFLPDYPDGTRWYNGPTWVNTLYAQRMEGVFPGQAGKSALGLDDMVYVNTGGNNVTDVLVFTSNDPFDPNNPMPPTNFGNGVDLNFGTGLAAGGWYFNVDLTLLSPPFDMPTTGQGWYEHILASSVTNGVPTEASSAQPLLWGTKVGNASTLGKYQYADGDSSGTGAGRNGTLQTLWDYSTGLDGTVTAYTVTRGVEQGTHDPNNLNGNPGQSAVVLQKVQFSPALNNAEIVATVLLDPNTDPTTANLRLLRAIVRAKANALPLNKADYNISLYNYSTSKYDVVFDGHPTNPAGDGDLTICASVPVSSIANYITGSGSSRTVQVKVGMKQLVPIIIGWKMGVNLITVDAADAGPDPLGPATAFSTPN